MDLSYDGPIVQKSVYDESVICQVRYTADFRVNLNVPMLAGLMLSQSANSPSSNRRDIMNDMPRFHWTETNHLILVPHRQNQQKSLNVTELLDQFRPLLTATILDEDEEHVLASCSYDRVRNLLQTRGCSNENRLRLWGLVLGLSSPPDVSQIFIQLVAEGMSTAVTFNEGFRGLITGREFIVGN